MSERYDCTLTNAAIDEISERIGDFLAGQKTAEKDRLRIRLSLEDILLNWQERFGEASVCTLRYGRQLGRAFLALEVPGEPFDPLPQEEDEFGGWSGRMLSGMGLRPIFSYAGGRNRVVLKLKKAKKSPLRSVALAALLGAAAGGLGACLPAGTLAALMEGVTDPMYNAFFGILDTLAGPLVFFAVAWGFYGVGDISTLSRVGKQMLLRFLAFQAAALTFTALLSVMCFELRFAAGEGFFLLRGVVRTLLSLFPTDVVTPFMHNDSMQIILLASLVGGALLILGDRAKQVAEFIEQANGVMQLLMELVGALLPLFIFLVVSRMFWTGSFGAMVRAWRALAVYLATAALMLAASLAAAGRQCGVSPRLLARKCFETFWTALKSVSSSASFDAAMGCCEERLGLESRFAGFGIPLGTVFFTPASGCYFLIVCVFMASAFQVEVSLPWMVLAVLLSGVLGVAAPPAPGGALACYTVMFLQLGIPGEALAAALTADVLFDVIATACDMTLLELELLRQGQGLGLVDREVLRNENF